MARCHCLCIAHLADSLYVPWVSELTQQRFVHSPQLERRSYVHEKKKRDVRCLWCFVPWSLLSWAPQWWRGQCFGSCQNQELFCHFPWPYWTANSDLRTTRQQTWTITARIPWWLTRDVCTHTQSQTGHHKTPGFFSRIRIKHVAFGQFFLFCLISKKMHHLASDINCIFNGSLSQSHGHSLNGTLTRHLSGNYHGVDKMWNDLFFRRKTERYSLQFVGRIPVLQLEQFF